jgi:gamma-glutamyltranspeptidase
MDRLNQKKYGPIRIIRAQNIDGCFWSQTITDIPVGKRLKLTAKIKTEDITGTGVSIAIRCDDSTYNEKAKMFATTEEKVSIIGTNDWTQYQVELTDKVTPNIRSITVFLTLLPKSGGTVWFDDISLIH